MKQLERRALYNLLRMNWLRDPSMKVEGWQVENYRALSSDTLLSALRQLDGQVDRSRFLTYASQCDNPEEMTACFLEEDVDPEVEDQVYLIVFELWRRWIPETPSLSIFCDDLDQQVFAFDGGEIEDDEKLQDAVANLLDILDESTDEGGDPTAVFERVSANCANDLGSFLYDYIAHQIDDENLQYAGELLEGFAPYLAPSPWVIFLGARLVARTDIDHANEMLRHLLVVTEEDQNLDLNLELLDFLSQTGDRTLFVDLAHSSLSLLEREEDLLELLRCASQYYRCLDQESREAAIEQLIEDRSAYTPDHLLTKDDPVFEQIRSILSR